MYHLWILPTATFKVTCVIVANGSSRATTNTSSPTSVIPKSLTWYRVHTYSFTWESVCKTCILMEYATFHTIEYMCAIQLNGTLVMKLVIPRLYTFSRYTAPPLKCHIICTRYANLACQSKNLIMSQPVMCSWSIHIMKWTGQGSTKSNLIWPWQNLNLRTPRHKADTVPTNC